MTELLFVLTVLVLWIVSGICAYWIAYRAGAVDNPEKEFFCCICIGLPGLLVALLGLLLQKIIDYIESR